MVMASCLKRRRSSTPPRSRLLCFPWCGAGASALRRLTTHLPADVDVLLVQLPGREERFGQRPLLTMDDVVAHVTSALAQEPDLPLALFGHSMGAVVAYDVAHALQAQGERPPQLLMVSGHGAPRQRAATDPQWHLAPEEELVAQLAELGGTQSGLLQDKAALQAILPALRADYQVLESRPWTVRAPLACPIVACCSTGDTTVEIQRMDHWRHLTDGPFELHWFDGDHFYLSRDPQPLARRMSQSMRRFVDLKQGEVGLQAITP